MKYGKRLHKTTPEEIQRVKELSNDFIPKEIAKQTGLAYQVVIYIQKTPKYGIVDPKRESDQTTFKKNRSLVPEGYYNPDEDPYFN